jgi:hypothetical protein
MKYVAELPIMSIENLTLAHFRHFSPRNLSPRAAHLTYNRGPRHTSTFVESALQIHPFYAKQTQFSELQNDVNSAHTKDYEDIRRGEVMKKQTQFKPNKAKNKPNSNPILSSFGPGKLFRCRPIKLPISKANAHKKAIKPLIPAYRLIQIVIMV